MFTNKSEAIDFINENDVKFIKLQFCDIFGTLKNVSIMPSQLELAFEDGIGFDASSVPGFLNEKESDLLLFPDPKTMNVLPWRPQQGRVVRFFCDVKRPDGTIFEGDGRQFIKRALRKAMDMGIDINIGPECEFYLFKTDENGKPTLTTHDEAGYFDVAPLDKGENIRREICLNLEEMGLEIESSHHETGKGQHEIVFKYAGALTAADNLITFKSVIKAITGRNGLFASFMPKPLNNMSGSGLHINISLFENGRNLFECEPYGKLPEKAGYFLAGVISHIKGISAFSNPLINSYKRIGGGYEAPKEISWSFMNRAQLVRIPYAKGTLSRMELRAPDPSCNPYIVFALIIEAGLEGINKKLKLEKENVSVDELPSSLESALNFAIEDSLIKNVIGEQTFNKYISAKKEEAESYRKTVHSWETDRYFYNI